MQSQGQGEPFSLPVRYNGKEVSYPARLVTMGYTYKIFVEANEVEIVFEPDEERNLRAIVNEGEKAGISTALVQAIGEALELHLR